ncbi:MAG: O-antigen ligase family protein [Chitinispirillaceae bacterium]|nr:O-antigen ligase family protein [Chitinispirillaceae bacterium]
MKDSTLARNFLILVAMLFLWYATQKVADDLRILTNGLANGGGFKNLLHIVVLLMVACISYFVFFPKKQASESMFFNFFLVWTIVITANAWLNLYPNEITYVITTRSRVIVIIQQALMHFCLFLFFFAVFRNYSSSLQKPFSYIVVIWYIVIALSYSINYSVLGELVHSGQSHLLGTSYILLYPLPLALSLKNKFWKSFCVIIGGIVVLSSIKRGGALGLAGAILVYYFVQNFYVNNEKDFVRKFFILILTIVLSLYSFITYDNVMNNGFIQERMNSISEDGGSGREEMATYLFNNIPNIPIDKLMFGYGYLGAMQFTPMHLSAHNDFLEVLYDYGLIGFTVYLWFYILFFRKIKLLIKQKSEYAAPLAAGFALLCILSMISHIIIFPYFAWFAIFLGVFDGITAEKLKIKI